jgi:hypothetical protein
MGDTRSGPALKHPASKNQGERDERRATDRPILGADPVRVRRAVTTVDMGVLGLHMGDSHAVLMASALWATRRCA